MRKFFKNKYVKFAVAAIVYTLLTVVWTGNLWMLLGLPLIYDFYISKVVRAAKQRLEKRRRDAETSAAALREALCEQIPRLREIERRKMWFDIVVNDEKGKCGEGSHLRVKVSQKGMADKAQQKSEG